MKKLILALVIFQLLLNVVLADDIPASWNELNSITVDEFEGNKITIYYDPQLSKIINKNVPDTLEGTKHIISTKISSKDSEIYIVEYSPGPSGDPQFSLYKKIGEKLTLAFNSFGLSLFIPGNGYLYISGHTNNTYNQRKKFERVKDKFIEVKQPFYYVGLASKTLKDITLYSGFDQRQIVTKVPKGTSIDVLLNYNDYYLLKTEFGLVGWLKLEATGQEATIIDGLYYFGD